MSKKEDLNVLNDKYDGSNESKAALSFLFMVAQQSVNEFVLEGKTLRTAMADHLNKKLLEFNNNSEKLTRYYNKEFRIYYYEDVLNLSKLLFNAITAYDAFKQFIFYSNEVKQKYVYQIEELKEVLDSLKKVLTAKFIDNNREFNIGMFIHDCRICVVHYGKLIFNFSIESNDDNTKNVPAIVIKPETIWKEEYMKQKQIPRDYYLDAIEIFENIASAFNEIQPYIDKIAESVL